MCERLAGHLVSKLNPFLDKPSPVESWGRRLHRRDCTLDVAGNMWLDGVMVTGDMEAFLKNRSALERTDASPNLFQFVSALVGSHLKHTYTKYGSVSSESETPAPPRATFRQCL